jgi:hypothetical protein
VITAFFIASDELTERGQAKPIAGTPPLVQDSLYHPSGEELA